VGTSERFLVRRLRRGDRDACRELIDRHHAGVYGYLRRLGAGAVLAEDLTQETYVLAWQRIETLRGAASLRSWLLTIARNQFFQWRRATGPATTPLENVPERVDDGPLADGSLTRDERDERLRTAVGRLDVDLEETVSLHYFQELSLREIGAVLGIPAGTVKSRLNRALRRLRMLLESMEADDARTRAEEALASDS
jgi:RNA polymerase sigma-70 factor (ECF subfamily)